jgi:transcriptional regulator with XRE-family HTH domain
MPRASEALAKNDETIGDRIRAARLARGLTQLQLGKKTGLSQRMVAYYEGHGVSPAPDLLVKLARALETSIDKLVGHAPRGAALEMPETIRLWRRVKKLQELPPQDRKSILKMIDALADQAARSKAS